MMQDFEMRMLLISHLASWDYFNFFLKERQAMDEILKRSQDRSALETKYKQCVNISGFGFSLRIECQKLM